MRRLGGGGGAGSLNLSEGRLDERLGGLIKDALVNVFASAALNSLLEVAWPLAADFLLYFAEVHNVDEQRDDPRV